ncbi:hypothetical protein [Parasedimentitalea huanghaiensis]|uniref:Uncharacterized protein n=1 Tax=Parasedimentitalea huanghaiensis TaxID=2682100 RepID=A0A6L6WL19_9RHOB|nr:hypothetical protein [Zongyanglinia huanghaiensis]MVO18131.1 hypothetical protein [Zongyanglinia huanghaiensis]
MAIDEQAPNRPSNTDQIDYLVNRLSELEDKVDAREASLEDQLRTLQIREAEQRIQIKQLVLVISVSVLVVMTYLILHAMHKVMMGPVLTVPRIYAMSLILAPVASITTITVALLVGSFRRFKPSDSDALVGMATEAAKAGAGQSG